MSTIPIGTGGQLLSVVSGVPQWVSTSSINYWQRSDGAIAPLNVQDDLLLGSNATASAKFGFLNNAIGTPTASISANNGGGATYLTGAGVLGTANGQSLTLGSTGNINFFNNTNVLTPVGNLTLAATTNTINGLSINAATQTLSAHNLSDSGALTIATGANGNLSLTPNGTGTVVIQPNAGGQSSLIINNLGSGDLLTASKAGATKFVVTNGGDLQFAGGQSSLSTITKAAGTAQTYTLPDETGTVCLENSANCGFSLGTNYWQSANPGTIAPYNTTVDVLLGGTSTASAKFAFINDNSGVPTASISANNGSGATFITGDGSLATANKQTLTLGSATTGNIEIGSDATARSIDLGNTTGTTGVNLTAGSGGIGLTTATGAITLTGTTNINTTGSSSTSIGNANGSSAVNLTAASGGINLSGPTNINNNSGSDAINIGTNSNYSGTITIGNSTNSDLALNDAQWSVTGAGAATFASITDTGNFSFSGSNPTISVSNSGSSLSIDSNGAGALNLNGTNTTGNVNIAGGSASTGCTVFNASGNLTCTGNITSTETTGIQGFLQRNAGALAPTYITDDFLLGSTATASAKFAFANVSGNGTPTASLSAGTTGATSLTATGVLGTTNKQTLQLGNGSTGNINFFNGNNVLTSSGDLTLAHNLTVGNNEVLTSGTLQVGNAANVSYNRLGTGTTAHGLNSQSDLLVSGDLEVGGNLYAPATGTSGYFQRNNNALAPTNITDDLLLGSTATASAKFAFINNAGGVPTASLSAGANNNTFLSADGTLGTTNGQTLNIGNTSTGNISINSPSQLNLNTINNANITTGTGLTTVGGNLKVNGTGVTFANNTTVTLGSSTTALNFASNLLNLDTTNTRVGINTNAPTATLDVNGPASVSGSLTFRSGAGSIQTTTNSPLTIGGGNTGQVILNGRNASNGITLANYGIGIIQSDTNGVLTSGAINLADNTHSVTGILPVVNGGSPFEETAGAITERITTEDLLLGATATSSAKFGFLNVGNGTPTATISGTGNNALSLTGDGTISTTNRQTLTVGGTNSGNVVIDSGSNVTQLSDATIKLSALTASRALFLDANSNIATTGTSANLAASLTDETGTGVAVFGTSPTITTSLVAGSSSFDLLNTTANTINFGGGATAFNIGASGVAVTLGNGGDATIQTKANTNSNLNILSQGSGNITLGQNSGNGTVVIQPNAGGQASLIVKNQGSGDLITASAGATTKFVITNGGDLQFAGGQSALSTITKAAGSSQTYTLPNETGTVCIEGSSNCGFAIGTNYWQTAGSGAIAPYNTTVDVLIGGTATNSAEFGILGVATGAPTATLSATTTGNGISLNANSATIQSLNKQTLTLGGTTTGTISLVGTVDLASLTSGIAHIGPTGIISSSAVDLASTDITGILQVPHGGSPFNENAGAIFERNTTEDFLLGSNATSSAKFAFTNVAGGTPTASISGTGNNALSLNGNGTIATTNGNSLALGALGTGNISLAPNGSAALTALTNGNIGIGTTTPTNFTLQVAGNIGPDANNTYNLGSTSFDWSNVYARQGNFNAGLQVGGFGSSVGTGTTPAATISGNTSYATAIIDQSGSGDIFTASKSGATKFSVLNNGNLQIYGAQLTPVTITSNATSAQSLALPNESGTICVENSTNCGFAIGTLYWDQANGALNPKNTTVDFLIGGTSTASAKFAVINVNPGSGTPTASVSGTTGAASLTASGILGTTNNQTLQLGNGSTGNVSIVSNGLTALTAAGANLTTGGTLTSTGLITANNGVTVASGNLKLTGFSTGEVLFTDNNANVTGVTGGVHQVLHGGTSPAFSAVDLTQDVSGILPVANGGSPFNENGQDNTIFERNTTEDLLLGSNATSSAKFGFLNVGSGVPTASISGTGNNALSLNGNGTLGTTNGQTLTIGTPSTGNINISQTGAITTINGTTVLSAFGTAGIIHNLANGTLTSGAINLAGGNNEVINILPVANGGSPFDQQNGAIFERTSSPDLLLGSNATVSAKFAFENVLSGVPTASLSAGTNNNTYLTADGKLGTTNAQTLTIGGASTGQIVLNGSNGAQNGITFQGYGTGIIHSTNGILTSSAVDLASGDVTGILPVNHGGSPFNEGNGSIFERNTTEDFLLGSNATSSAKFAFTNVEGGTPTASISGTGNNALSLTGDGTIGTTNGQSLTLGTTGNINFFNANNSITSAGNLALNGTTISAPNLTTLTSSANLTITATGLTLGNNATINGGNTSGGTLTLVSTANGTQGNIQFFNSSNTISPTGVLTLSGGNTPDITTSGSNSNLTLAAKGSGNIILTSNYQSGVKIGSSANTPAPLSISGGIGNNGALIVNQINSGDIFDASLSGTTKFAIANDGTATFYGASGTVGLNASTVTSSYNLILPTTTGISGQALILGGGGQLGWTNVSTGVNPWDLLNNAIIPKDNQYDLLLGGNSTASAKFAFINNGNGTPTASISAQDGSGSALSLTPNSLTTQNAQTLTIGGTSTGNIVLNSAGSTALTASGANLTGAGTFTSTGLLKASNGFTVGSGTITFTGYNTGVVLSNNLGQLSYGAIDLSNSNYVSNILPVANGGSPFNVANGSIFERNTTEDLLLGSNATVSAKFAFENVAGGTPTASISGTGNNSLSITGDGTIATTNKQTLTLGSTSTGNIVLNGFATGIVHSTAGVLSSSAINLNGGPTEIAGILPVANGGSPFEQNNGAIIERIATQDFLVGGTASASAQFGVTGIANGTPTATISATTNNNGLSLTASNATIQSLNNNTLTLGGNSTGNIVLNANGTVALTIQGANLVANNGTLTGLNGLTSAGQIKFTGLTTDGVVTVSNGILSSEATLPVANGGSPFDQANGTIFERNTTQDLILGSNATASAKFAFINVGNGTPTASISGANNNATYLTATGILATSNAQTLQLGDSNTGNINFFNSNNALTPGGNLSLNGTTITAANLTTLTSSLNLTVSATGLTLGGSATINGGTASSGTLTLVSTTNATKGNIQFFNSNNTISSTGVLTLAGGQTSDITTGANNSLTITPNGSGNTILTSDFNSGVKIGSSANTIAPLSVSGGIGNNGALIVNQTNSGDIFDASHSGTTKFAVANDGTLKLYGATTGYVGIVAPSSVGSPYTLTLPNATPLSNGQALVAQTDGTLSWTTVATGVNPWDLLNGAIIPKDNNYDLLLGGQSTASAKFAFTNSAGGVPTASVSANNNSGATYLTGDGTLGTANKQTLNIGSSSTGNINISQTGATTTIAGIVDLSGLSTGIAHIGSTGIITSSAVNLASTDVSGILPVANGGSPFNELSNNAIIERNTTEDLLLGSNATSSAKFGFLNVGSGTPTASISGTGNNALSLTGDGSLGTTNGQTLTIGTPSTGNIVLSSAGTTALTVQGVNLVANNGTLTGLNGITSAGTIKFTGLTTDGVVTVSGGTLSSSAVLPVSEGGSPFNEGNGSIFERNTTEDLLLGSTATTSARFAVTGINAGNTPTATLSAGLAGGTYLTATGNLATTNKQTLTLGGTSTGNITLANNTTVGGNLTVNGTGITLANNTNVTLGSSTTALNFASNLLNLDTQNTRVGIGTNAPTATLDVNGGAVATSFDARATTSLTIGGSNATGITLGKTGVATTIGNISTTGVALLSNTGVISSGTVDLSSPTYVSNVLGIANGGSPFNVANGAIFERNTTEDLLLGSNATSSAKFGFLNVAGGTPTASISGTGNNTTSITGNGLIGTTNGQSLTLGTTGNVNFFSSANVLDTAGNLSLAGNGTFAGATGLTLSANGAALAFTGTGTNTISTANNSNLALMPNGTGEVGIGTTTPTALLDVNGTASVGGQLTFRSGTAQIQSTAKQTLTIGGTSTGNIVLSPLNGSGNVTISGLGTGIVQSNNGVLSSSAINLGTIGSSYITGILPVANGGSPFSEISNNAIVERNTNEDLLLGSNATSSAKFGFLNVGAGTPTASISGANNNALSLTATGTIQTTNAQSLLLNPNGFGNVGIGTANPTSPLTVNGTITTTGPTGSVQFNARDNSGNFSSIYSAGGDLTFYTSVGGIRATLNNSGQFGIGPNAGFPHAMLDVGANTYTTPVASFSGQTGLSTVVVDQSGVGDIFTASKSGATKFTVLNNGNVQINNLGTGVVQSNASGILSSGAIDLSSPSYVTNILGISNGGSPFNVANGSIFERNTTEDLLLGSNATSSARFGFLNVAGGTPTASISGTGTNALSITGDGSIQTTNGHSLSLNGNGFGNVGIGTTNPTSPLTVNGAIEALAAGIKLDATDHSANFFSLYSSNGNLEFYNNNGGIHGAITQSGKFGIGTNNDTPVAQLDVLPSDFTQPAGYFHGSTGVATLELNQTSATDIFTASASGVTKFTIANDGTAMFYGASGTVGLNAATATSNYTLNLPTTITGKTGQALILGTGGQLDWTTVATGTNPWDLLNNAIIPKDNQYDLLLGGTSTASAKFAFTNNGSGIPTASISANSINNALYLTGDGKLGTTNGQTLTLGSASTGNIVLSPNGTSTFQFVGGNSNLTTFVSGATGNQTVTFPAATGGAGTVCYQGDSNCGFAVGTLYWDQANGALNPKNTTVDLLIGGTSTASAKFAVINVNPGSGTPTASISGTGNAGLSLSGAGQIQSINGNTLTLGGNTTGNIAFNPGNIGSGNSLYLSSNGLVGIGTANPGAGLDLWGTQRLATNSTVAFKVQNTGGSINALQADTVNGRVGINVNSSMLSALDVRASSGTTSVTSVSGATTFANTVIDQSGTGDIFTASKSGASKFTVLNNGNVRINNLGLGVVQSDATGLLSSSALNLGNSSLVTGILPVVNGGSPFNENAGSIVERNTTEDLLLGSNATSSARFGFINVNSGTPVATISAGTSGALTLSANGTLATTAKQSLTLGDANTGNIILSNNVIQTGANNFTTGTGMTTVGGNLTVGGTQVTFNNPTNIVLANNASALTFATNLLTLNTANSRIGIGTTTPTATLDVAGTASVAGELALNTTPQIQSTAKQTLTIGGDTTGNILLAPLNGSGNVTISSLGTGIVQTNNSGVLSSSAINLGTIGSSYITGILPVVNGGSPFSEISNNAIVERNTNEDLLLGSNATASAKFGFLNVGAGTPTATISGTGNNALSLTGDGTIGTTNGQSLTIGTTGNVNFFNGNSFITSGGNLTLNGSTVTAPNLTTLTSNTNLAISATGLTLGNNATINGGNTSGGTLTLVSTANATKGNIQFFSSSNNISPTGVLNLAGGNTPDITTSGVNNNLTLAANGSGNTILGQNAGNGTVVVQPNAGGQASLIVKNQGAGDLLTASAGATTKFTVDKTGQLIFAGGQTNANSTLNSLATSATIYTLPATGGTICINGSSSCGFALGTNYWQAAGVGAIAPYNTTVDLLVGSTSTASAQFGILGVATGAPTATLSATTNGKGLSLTANTSTIQSLNNSTLTIGGSSTGNIVLSPLAGNGTTTLQGTVALSSLSSGIAHIGTGGVITSSAINLASSDVTGILPVVNGGSPFNEISNNAIVERNTNEDLLLGSNATASAKFGFLNVGTGTPTASISGTGNNRLTLTGDGTIGTTNGQSLTLGTTGNVNFFSSSNLIDTLGNLSLAGNGTFGGASGLKLTANGASLAFTGGGTNTISTASNGNLALLPNGTGEVGIGTNTPTALLDVNGSASVSGSLTFRNGAGSIQTTGNNTLTIGGTSTGNIVLSPLNGTGGNVTINGTTTLGGLTYTWPASQTNGYVLQTNGSGVLSWINPASLGTNYWDLANGAINAKNTTVDLLLGGTSTASAKFAFTNVAGGTPTASISGANNNALSLTATGTLATTNGQTLTLGSTSTGNIDFNPNGLLVASISAVNNGTFTLGNSTNANNLFQIWNDNSNPGFPRTFFQGGTSSNDSNWMMRFADTYSSSTNIPAGIELSTNNKNNFSGANTLLMYQTDSEALLSTAFNSGSAGVPIELNTGGGASVSTPNLYLDTAAHNYEVGIGTKTPGAQLDVTGLSGTSPVGKFSGTTAKAALLAVNSGVGDLFTASSGASTKFTITNNGSITFAGGQSSLSTLALAASAPTTITFPAAGGNNTVCYQNDSNCGFSVGTNVWQLNNNAISPSNSTFDVLLGGTATSSAKFGFLNNAGGTPTASISAVSTNNALSLDASGNIFTTNKQTLTLGAASTGNIAIGTDNTARGISIGNTTGASSLTLSAGSGNAAGDINMQGGIINIGASSIANKILNLGTTGNTNAASTVHIADTNANATQSITIGNTASANNVVLISGGTNSTAIQLQAGSGGTISLANNAVAQTVNIGNTTGASTVNLLSGTGNITLGSSTGNGTVFVQPNAGGQASLIVKNQGSGDLFTASSGATTKFVVNANGNIQFTGSNGSNFLTTLTTSGATGAQTITFPAAAGGAGTVCYQNDSNCGFSVGTNVWQLNNKAISPSNSTYDVLFGGTATNSAKFAFINNAGTATPVASISALNSNGTGLSFNGNGSLQALNNNTLTIGGNTTGNIAISPLNGNGTVSINGALNVSSTGTFANITDTGLAVNSAVYTDASHQLTTSAPTSGSIGYWLRQNGALSPTTPTDDLLLGSSATTSAKFAFTNVAGGTPTASISGTGNNALSLDGQGNIGTTNKQSLTLGTASTGNINFFNANSYINSSGYLQLTGPIQIQTGAAPVAYNRLGIGVTAFPTYITDTNDLLISGNLEVQGNLLTGSTGIIGLIQRNNGALSPTYSTDDLLLGSTATSSAKFAFINVAGGTPVASISGNVTLNAAGVLGTTNEQTLNLGSATTGNINFVVGAGNAISVNGVNNVATLTNSSCVNVSNGFVTGPGSGCAGSTNFWQVNGNAISPYVSTDDLLVGGTATTSASFHVFGSAAGSSNPVASIAANTSAAGLVVDQKGSGAIIKAGNDGKTLFTVDNGGNVGIGKSPALDLSGQGATILATGAAQFTSLSGAGLTDCGGATQKILWSNSTKTFSCGTNIGTVKSFVSAASINVTTNNTTDYWDHSVSSDPTITLSSATDEIMIQAHIEFSETGTSNTANVLASRITRSTDNNSPTSGNNCLWAGNKIQVGNPNTVAGPRNAIPDFPALSFTYIDATASANGTNPLYYTVCSSSDNSALVGTPQVIRIDMILSEVGETADVAELYPSNSTTMSPGDILTSDPTLQNGVQTTNSANDSHILGVFSTNPSQIVGGASTGGNTSVPVTLNGRVPVKVTTLNGNIASGSGVTSSNLPGFGMNQTQPSAIVGKALEGTDTWNSSTCTVLDDWSQVNSFWPSDDGTNWQHPCFAVPTSTVPNVPTTYTQPYVYVGKVMMKVDIGYNTPVSLTSLQGLQILQGGQIPGVATPSAYFLTDSNNTILTNTEAFSDLFAANGTFGSLNANQLTAATISAQTLNMNGVTLNGNTNGLSFTNNSNQPLFSLDTAGNATLSGQLTVGSLKLANGMITSDSLGNMMEQLATDTNNGNPTQFKFQNASGKNLLALDSNGNATIAGTLTSNAGNFDVAEDYPTKDQSIVAGDVLSVDQTNDGHVQKSSGAYDKTIIGVYSTAPGFRLSESNDTINGDKAVPVALTGRVPVKVSLENGPIHKGDYLTSSSVPGVAMKATEPGQVLGKALADFDCTTSPLTGSCTGTVLAFVNVTFADPNNVLSTAVTFHDQVNSLAADVQSQIDALAVQVKNNTDQITHLNTVIDQLLKFAATFHDQVNNDATQIAALNNRVNNLENVTPTPAPTNTGFEATTSATLQKQNNEISNLKSQIASMSSNTNNITNVPIASSEAIFGLSTLSDQVSSLEQQVLSINMANELASHDATISGTFNVFGKTTVQDLGVTGNITAGVMTINGLDQSGQASINSVGDLKLQSNGAGGINILNGKIKIDTNGNITSKGEITVKKVNIDTSDVKAASLGTMTIKAGDTIGIATTSALTKNSKIFATPVNTPVAVSADKARAKNTLMIHLAEPQTEDIKVNWWIVN